MAHFPNDEPIARRDDLDSSHQSAEELTESGERDRQKTRVLQAVTANPGKTSRELAAITGIPNEVLHKRLPDLRTDQHLMNGQQRQCSVTLRRAVTWYIKPQPGVQPSLFSS
jgi:hypothetical protein